VSPIAKNAPKSNADPEKILAARKKPLFFFPISKRSLKLKYGPASYGTYKVNYDILSNLKRKLLSSIKGNACYGDLSAWISNLKEPCFIQADVFLTSTKEEMLGLLRLGQISGIIPGYVDVKKTESIRKLELSTKLSSKHEVYAALTYVRFLRDDIFFVENLLHLVLVEGFKFWPAFFYCMAANVRGTGHNFMPIARVAIPNLPAFPKVVITHPDILFKAVQFFSGGKDKTPYEYNPALWKNGWKFQHKVLGYEGLAIRGGFATMKGLKLSHLLTKEFATALNSKTLREYNKRIELLSAKELNPRTMIRQTKKAVSDHALRSAINAAVDELKVGKPRRARKTRSGKVPMRRRRRVSK